MAASPVESNQTLKGEQMGKKKPIELWGVLMTTEPYVQAFGSWSRATARKRAKWFQEQGFKDARVVKVKVQVQP
jgi:hypothetical protein